MNYLLTIGQIIAIIGPILTIYGVYRKYWIKPTVKLTSPFFDLQIEDLTGFPTPNLKSAFEALNSIPIELCNDDENRVCTIRQCFLEECFSWFRLFNWLKTKFKGPTEAISLPLQETIPVNLKPKNSVILRIDINEARSLAYLHKGKLTRVVIKHSRGCIKSSMFYVEQIFTYYSCAAESFSTCFVKRRLLNALEEHQTPASFLDETLEVMKKLKFTEVYAAWKIASIVKEESKVRNVPKEFLNLADMRFEKIEGIYRKFMEIIAIDHLSKKT